MHPTGSYNQTTDIQNFQRTTQNEQFSVDQSSIICTDASVLMETECSVHDTLHCILNDSKIIDNKNSGKLHNYTKVLEYTTMSESSNEALYLNNFDRSTEEHRTATISELVDSNNTRLMNQQNRIRTASSVVLRLLLPLANGVICSLGELRGAWFLRILKSLTYSGQALTNLLTYAANAISISLSSVHVTYRKKDKSSVNPTRKNLPLSFLFRELKVSNPRSVIKISPPLECKVPKCVTIKVIAEPPSGTPIRADIVIIHGLHGSLKNTWKQGIWNNDRHPVNFKRPPKPPVRPPKRARHSRSNIFGPPHKEKRARFTDREHFEAVRSNDAVFSYECGEREEIHVCNGVEYNLPKFRFRMENHGLLLKDAKDEMKRQPSSNNSIYSNCWPADWLPLDCPGVRVIAVNYTTDQYLWRPLWRKKEQRSNLVERSREMSELLIEHRVGYGHPIVWVGHSKGGLFVKQIIVDAWESGRPEADPLWRSSRGTFFYSVPHRGSHLASIKAPLLCRSVELLDVEKNSKYLLDLHRRFAGLYYMGHLKIEVFSFVETALTLMSVLFLRIVGVDSADPGIGDVCGIQLDHREICKPRNRDCILYKELVKMIKKVC